MADNPRIGAAPPELLQPPGAPAPALAGAPAVDLGPPAIPAGPVKRGRGRPRKDGLPPVQHQAAQPTGQEPPVESGGPVYPPPTETDKDEGANWIDLGFRAAALLTKEPRWMLSPEEKAAVRENAGAVFVKYKSRMSGKYAEEIRLAVALFMVGYAKYDRIQNENSERVSPPPGINGSSPVGGGAAGSGQDASPAVGR